MLRFGLVALVLVAGCDKKKTEGLPPAQDWNSPPEGASAVPGVEPMNPHGGGRIDPHAGVAGAPPLGGSEGGSDPHAGIPGAPPLGGGGGGGGGGDGVDVAQMGLPAPDPD